MKELQELLFTIGLAKKESDVVFELRNHDKSRFQVVWKGKDGKDLHAENDSLACLDMFIMGYINGCIS